MKFDRTQCSIISMFAVATGMMFLIVSGWLFTISPVLCVIAFVLSMVLCILIVYVNIKYMKDRSYEFSLLLCLRNFVVIPAYKLLKKLNPTKNKESTGKHE